MNALIPANLPIQLNDLGIEFEGDLTFEQWSEIGQKVGLVARTAQFFVGDWINYGQDRWNGGKFFDTMPFDLRQKYDEAMRLTGLEMNTLKVAAYVARRIPLKDRRANLTFTHHRLVARVKDEEKRRGWLQKTERSGLSTRRLRASLISGEIVSEREMERPARKGRKTHLLLIVRLGQWWAKKKVSAEYEEMTREQLESVIDDFGPILGILEELRERATRAQAYLD